MSGGLAPHALEARALPERGALRAAGLGDAGWLGREHGDRPRVDLHVLDVDLGVEVELGAVQQESI